MTKFTPHVVKIDFNYKIYTTCIENSYIYTTYGENCHSNVVVTFSVISKIGPTFLTTAEDISVCGENYLTMPSGVENFI